MPGGPFDAHFRLKISFGTGVRRAEKPGTDVD